MKHVVISGGAGGLGSATARFLAEEGWKVYALDYQLDGLEQIHHPNIVGIQMDITQDDSVQCAFEQVKQQTNVVHAVINFAGILALGSMIERPTLQLERILNVNVIGMYRINHIFFPLLKSNESRIVNISSETGVLSPPPFSGFYYTSKRAVEVYSDALRRELKYLHIPVIKIRPGAFATKMQGTAMEILQRTIDESIHFKKQLTKGNDMAEFGTGSPKDPRVLAKVIHKALGARKPRMVYSANLNWTFKILSALPEKLQDFIYYQVLK